MAQTFENSTWLYFSYDSNFSQTMSGGDEENENTFWLASVVSFTIFAIVASYLSGTFMLERLRQKDLGQTNSVILGFWMRIFRDFMAAAYTFVMLLALVEKLIVEEYCPSYCFLTISGRSIFGGLALMCCFLVLSLRQRVLYGNKLLEHLTTKTTQVLSISVFLLAILHPITVIILYIVTYRFGMTPRGCGIVGSRFRLDMLFIGTSIASIFEQFVLLHLFLAPLYKHRSTVGEAADNLKPVLIRAFVAACMWTGGSIALMVMGSFFKSQYGSTLVVVLARNVINFLFVIYSFTDWKSSVFPFCSKQPAANGEN